jgi:hypothetical protein
MPRKTSSDDRLAPEAKRRKSSAKGDPVKILVKAQLERLARDTQTIEADVAFDDRQLNSADVEGFVVFFRMVEDRLEKMKREIHYRRAELFIDATKKGLSSRSTT